MGGSPQAEDDGSGRKTKVNAGGSLLFPAVDASFSRAALRLGGFCEAAQQGKGRARGSGAAFIGTGPRPGVQGTLA
jgi:hypothetical protein